MKNFVAINGSEVALIQALTLADATDELFFLTKGKPKPDFIVRQVTNLDSLSLKLALLNFKVCL
tara:strand:+ start:1086 stop:1277 length:192 start_codon:yes stop_codon:yes gene_type:complete